MKVLRGMFWVLAMVVVSGGLAVGAAYWLMFFKEDSVAEATQLTREDLFFLFHPVFFLAAVGWIATVRRVLVRLAAGGWKKYVAAVAYYLLWCGFFFFVAVSLFAE